MAMRRHDPAAPRKLSDPDWIRWLRAGLDAHPDKRVRRQAQAFAYYVRGWLSLPERGRPIDLQLHERILDRSSESLAELIARMTHPPAVHHPLSTRGLRGSR